MSQSQGTIIGVSCRILPNSARRLCPTCFDHHVLDVLTFGKHIAPIPSNTQMHELAVVAKLEHLALLTDQFKYHDFAELCSRLLEPLVRVMQARRIIHVVRCVNMCVKPAVTVIRRPHTS